MTKKYWIGGGVVLLVIVIGAFFFFSFQHRAVPARSGTASTTDLGNGIQVQTTGGGSVTVTQVPITPGPTGASVSEPSLDRPITFTGSVLPPDAQTIVKAQMEAIIATLKKDPSQLTMWLQLGIDRKQAGDYEGAREAWAYVQAVAPKDEISAVDLADLFANFIKDYPQAETYYLKAIVDAPAAIDNYRNLYTLYHYSYKVGSGADVAILKEGLANNPGNPDLEQLLAQQNQQ
jgi:hypothetical protein